MNDKAFSEIRALLHGAVPPLPKTYAEYDSYKAWHLHMLKSMRKMFRGDHDAQEVWSILTPYFATHPSLLKTLGGMDACCNLVGYASVFPYPDWTHRSALALVAYHTVPTMNEQGLSYWTAIHYPYNARPLTEARTAYKGPFEVPYDLWAKAVNPKWLCYPRPTIFGEFTNKALRLENREVFVAVHDAKAFYEDVAHGDLRGYTRDILLGDQGSDWLSFLEWGGSNIDDTTHEYHRDRRYDAIMHKYERNIYATVLVDDSGLMTYIPDVCYDLPLPDDGLGFFYDCYE